MDSSVHVQINCSFCAIVFHILQFDFMSLLQYCHHISKAFSLNEFRGDMTMDDSVPMCQGTHNSPRWNGSSVCQKQKSCHKYLFYYIFIQVNYIYYKHLVYFTNPYWKMTSSGYNWTFSEIPIVVYCIVRANNEDTLYTLTLLCITKSAQDCAR